MRSPVLLFGLSAPWTIVICSSVDLVAPCFAIHARYDGPAGLRRLALSQLSFVIHGLLTL